MHKIEFFTTLRSIAEKYAFGVDPDHGEIRGHLDGFEFEPVTAVCDAVTGQRFDLDDYMKAGEALGLESKLVDSIAFAADSEYESLEPGEKYIRDELLAAIGHLDSDPSDGSSEEDDYQEEDEDDYCDDICDYDADYD